jgi:hypothetical protein
MRVCFSIAAQVRTSHFPCWLRPFPYSATNLHADYYRFSHVFGPRNEKAHQHIICDKPNPWQRRHIRTRLLSLLISALVLVCALRMSHRFRMVLISPSSTHPGQCGVAKFLFDQKRSFFCASGISQGDPLNRYSFAGLFFIGIGIALGISGASDRSSTHLVWP